MGRLRKIERYFSLESAQAGEPSFWLTPAVVLGTVLQVVGGATLGIGFSAPVASAPAALTSVFWMSGVCLFVGVTLLVVSAKSRTKYEERLQQRNVGQLHSFVDPLAEAHDAVQKLLDSPRTDKDCEEFFDSIATAAAKIFPGDGIRVCIFKLEGDEGGSHDSQTEGALLRLRADGGRPDHARSVLRDDTPHGQKAIEVAKGRQPWCVTDPDEWGKAVERDENAAWSSFMQVPVISRRKNVGSVSIDSRARLEFSTEHQAVGALIAGLVSLGESVAMESGIDVVPEITEAWRDIKRLRRPFTPDDSRNDTPRDHDRFESHGRHSADEYDEKTGEEE